MDSLFAGIRLSRVRNPGRVDAWSMLTWQEKAHHRFSRPPQLATVAGFRSEEWPTSNRNGGPDESRNGGRLQIGIGGRITSDSAPWRGSMSKRGESRVVPGAGAG